MLHLGQLTKSVTNATTAASFRSRKERKRRRRVYISRTTFGLQKIVSAANVDFIQAGSVMDILLCTCTKNIIKL